MYIFKAGTQEKLWALFNVWISLPKWHWSLAMTSKNLVSQVKILETLQKTPKTKIFFLTTKSFLISAVPKVIAVVPSVFSFCDWINFKVLWHRLLRLSQMGYQGTKNTKSTCPAYVVVIVYDKKNTDYSSQINFLHVLHPKPLVRAEG